MTEELRSFAEYIDHITEGADSNAGTQKGSKDGEGRKGQTVLSPPQYQRNYETAQSIG